MIKRKRTRGFTRTLLKIFQTLKRFFIRNIQWLLRSLPRTSRRHKESGFVLPTTVMLLLIVTLVVTALLFRTFSRTTQAISERQQQVIYNTATPAIDRAKAKIEYLFRQDTRLPAGVPSDSTIQNIFQAPASGDDVYKLPDETRLDFKDTNNNPGIGWYFRQNNKTIAYSIIFKKQVRNTTGSGNAASVTDSASNKAPYLVVRNGPVNTSNSGGICDTTIQLASDERDWEPITSATLAKTFQVTAFAVENANKANRTITTLELQQDRQADKGNKWGAYFRYDLELFHGSSTNFRWNGAMHSDANMFLAPYGSFRAYLISSPASCVNTSANDSKITVSKYSDTSGNVTFEGQIAAGRLAQEPNEIYGGNSTIDLYNGSLAPTGSPSLTKDNDSVTPDNANESTILPAHIAVEPVALMTQDVFKSRGSDTTNTSYRTTDWKSSNFVQRKRIYNEEAIPPYLDDTYRADNRYGPNPTYDGKPFANSQIKIPSASKAGDVIPSTDTNYSALTRNDPPTNNPEAVGLDGYWERRAVKGGLRVVVGQRLLLGNPLAVPTNAELPSSRKHEFLQRRTQRDNLSAVQATAVYHYKSGSGTTPVACMATTVHPGTAETLKRSATFETIKFRNSADTELTRTISDFFTGRGTNGWEFSYPGASTALENARKNLADFAGDPDGAFPAKQEASTSTIMHPYPELARYGDFSNLRRALSGTSIADEAYKDTANCLLGMLAYNINYLNDYDYGKNWHLTNTSALLDDLNAALLTAASSVAVNQPEQAIAALEASSVDNKVELVKLAKLIAAKEQVDRDRRNNVSYTCTKTKFNALATALDKLCPAGAKYEALYYIFPTADHAEARTDTYITGTSVNPTSLTTRYKAITIADIAATTTPNTGTWSVPRSDVTATVGTASNLPNNNTTNLNNLVRYIDAAGTTTYYQVAFKDAALFNGREMMNVRVLDVDLNLLRTNSLSGDTWLPINDNTATDTNAPPPNGLVYAFREDAVREDAIARPVPTTTPTTAIEGMNATPGSLRDPVVSSNGISVKPVDYFPDPDRRPFGFRLKNGSRLDRGTNSAGMTFVSDNTVYIQGDFNLHSTDGTNSASTLLEEFKNADTTSATPDNQGKLKDDWSNFYTRNRKDDRFAKPATDTWRPTEVLGDAVTIVSSNFCDGSIEDGIIYPNVTPPTDLPTRYGCDSTTSGPQYTSYLNQNRPSAKLTDFLTTRKGLNDSAWARENPADSASPVRISATGKPWYLNTSSTETQYEEMNHPLPSSPPSPKTYLRFSETDPNCTVVATRKCVGVASATRVNTILVQNIIPSRGQQSYGGFHNFPRMIENWNGKDLHIGGAFIQLRFSTQATGLFDQDAWEVGTSTTTASQERYFNPPNRRWGYDVALQFQTAGPVARRFKTPGTTRSEVYRELPLDDPYIQKLRCAKDSDGNQIDSIASCT
ncbi:hormogonium polysaccharide biosynthesis protein HpsA [Fortiea contorta]|uniref:hormogonium polysaccharide biosynthesis protein HpsA n=1 Tax=Fortiea contorta TaxID=1892405 RepID=UPI000348F58C|nr:hormogonium polysaccharide biosynthesis protein HpsA [Fortiea contorta]